MMLRAAPRHVRTVFRVGALHRTEAFDAIAESVTPLRRLVRNLRGRTAWKGISPEDSDAVRSMATKPASMELGELPSFLNELFGSSCLQAMKRVL